MALKFITNSVYRDCACLYESGSFGDIPKLHNVAGLGERYLYSDNYNTSTSVEDFNIQYVELGGTLTANTCIITRADTHFGHGVSIKSYSSFPATSTTIYSTSSFPASTLGYLNQDWIYEFETVTNKQAFEINFSAGTGGDYIPKVYGVTFGDSLSFDYVASGVTYELYQDRVQLGDRNYKVQDKINVTLEGVTRSQITELEALLKGHKYPLWLYDSVGNIILEKLYHCIIPNKLNTQITDNYHTINFDAYRLWQY
jgi:hypothetical protein